jgi:adenylyltransferase/sulfurtransferase
MQQLKKLNSCKLNNDERQFYNRHLLLSEVGIEGQKRLKDSKVLLVGVGGLGSPLAIYLAAAGVGCIGIVEFDHVDVSNLHRQVLYTYSQIGLPKIDCAAERISQMNPHIEVVKHAEVLTRENAMEIIGQYDIVADGSDNFSTRYLVNDACVLLKKPNVHAAVFQFEGQLSILGVENKPCYRCLYPEPPPSELIPSCLEAGVLGVLPGIMGCMQASEVIKLCLGIGENMAGRLLRYDLLNLDFEIFEIESDPNCKICSPSASQVNLVNYDVFCSDGVGLVGKHRVAETSIRELYNLIQFQNTMLIIDIRSEDEYQHQHIINAISIPFNYLSEKLEEYETSHQIVLYCHNGQSSRQAASSLIEDGFTNVKSLKGGIHSWNKQYL